LTSGLSNTLDVTELTERTWHVLSVLASSLFVVSKPRLLVPLVRALPKKP
jgi:hypothetical protein